MAINVSFNGAVIYRPSSVSKTTIDVGGGFQLGTSGFVAVIGEADAGAPGASEVNLYNNRFVADQLPQIRTKYRSGPIADAAGFLFSPGSDGAIPSGAQTVWFYKTNQSIRASLALANTYAVVRANEYGVGGNRISYTNAMIAETPASIVSTAPFNEALILAGAKFDLRINGGAKNTFTVPAFILPATVMDKALLITVLADAANWSTGLPTGMTIVVGGIAGACTLSVAMTALSTQYQLGYGRSFELTDGASTPLTIMKIVTAPVTSAFVTAVVEPSVTIKVAQKRDNIIEEETLGGNIVLNIGHDGSGGVTAATVTIDATSIILKQGGTAVHTIPKASYVILKDLVDELNLVTYGGWSASIASSLYNQLSLDVLDHVTDIGAFSVNSAQPARIKKDASEVADMFANSISASLVADPTVGLPGTLAETMLTGGAKGVTTMANIVDGLAKFEKFHVNFVLPLFSRDATADASDALTESGSTYTIAGVHQAVKTHISLMKTTKKKSERQGMLSFKGTYANCQTQASVLADGRLQLMIQDIRQADVQGNIKWFQPWALAALMAGARSGAPIGTPMTYKFLNLSGIRQTGQAMSTADADIVIDFDPDLQAEDAIQSGITFLEAPQTGGFRVVVDNTTYGIDSNFLWNRANVVYAGDIIAYNFRNAMETFIGRKNTITVSDVIGVADSVLGAFLGQGITVSTPDAPQGYKALSAKIVGSVIYVYVTVKIVEGIDWVLSDITIQRAVQ